MVTHTDLEEDLDEEELHQEEKKNKGGADRGCKPCKGTQGPEEKRNGCC